MTRSLVSLANDNRVENNLNEVLVWCLYTMDRPEEEEEKKKKRNSHKREQYMYESLCYAFLQRIWIGLDTFGSFLVSFWQIRQIWDFQSTSLIQSPPGKKCTVNLAFSVDTFSEGRQNNFDRVASLNTYMLHFNM